MTFHLVVLFVAYSLYLKQNSTTENSDLELIMNSPKCKEHPIRIIYGYMISNSNVSLFLSF